MSKNTAARLQLVGFMMMFATGLSLGAFVVWMQAHGYDRIYPYMPEHMWLTLNYVAAFGGVVLTSLPRTLIKELSR